MTQVLASLRRTHHDETGVTAVEFSLLVLPLCLLVFGVVDFGLGIWTYNNLSQAVNQGAREAIVRGAGSTLGTPLDAGNNGSFSCSSPPPAGSIAGQVCSSAVPLDPNKLSGTVSWTCPTCGVSSQVTVSGRYDFEPILKELFPVAMTLKSEATMRVACCKQP